MDQCLFDSKDVILYVRVCVSLSVHKHLNMIINQLNGNESKLMRRHPPVFLP